MTQNQKIVLDNRPAVEASASNFKLVSEALPALQDGQVLVRHHYLSLDPYMRGRMNDSKSYAASQGLGEVMIGGTVGEVVESQHAKYAVGDKVVGMGGWQQFMRPGEDYVVAKARLMHRTATLAFTEGSVYNRRADGSLSEMIAHATGTFKFLKALATSSGAAGGRDVKKIVPNASD